MRKLFLAVLLFYAIHSSGQVSVGFSAGASAKQLLPKDQAMDRIIFLGATFKKYVTPTINLVTGAGYRMIDITVLNLPEENDLVTFFKDTYPNEFYYITGYEYFRLHYLHVPIGLEYKVTTFMRLSYMFDNNILLGVNSTTKEYLQYGKKAVAQYMPTNTFSVMLHSGNAVGVAFNLTLNPGVIRQDLHYTYNYMNEYSDALRKSTLFTISLWGDLTFKTRKKI